MCNGSGGGAMITATGAFLEVSRGWYANNSVVTGYGAGLSLSLDLSGVRRGGWYSGLYEKVVRGACGTDSFHGSCNRAAKAVRDSVIERNSVTGDGAGGGMALRFAPSVNPTVRFVHPRGRGWVGGFHSYCLPFVKINFVFFPLRSRAWFSPWRRRPLRITPRHWRADCLTQPRPTA